MLLQIKQNIYLLKNCQKKAKGLTKDLINEFSILNGAKYFKIIQYLYQVNILVALVGLIRGNLTECLKNILKI